MLHAQLARKLKLLEGLGYIASGLTAKGHFASRMYGFELQTTEMYFHRYHDKFDDDTLCAVAAAIPFEARKGVRYDKPHGGPLLSAARSVSHLVGEIRDREEQLGVFSSTRLPDFQIALPAYHWSQGAEFEDLARFTDEDPGDLVRALRMAVQILRQMLFAVDPEAPERSRLRRCIARMNRGVVNAEEELEASLTVPEQE